MLLDVPFLPELEYIHFLQKHAPSLYSIHYGLDQEHIPDGRHKTAIRRIAELNEGLSKLIAVKKYALLNSRFYSPSTYLDHEQTSRILTNLELLLEDGNIDGVTVVDLYLLQALSDASPEIAGNLEASPGINCMLDSFDKIRAVLAVIQQTNFKFPSKLNLDRSLNRRVPSLEAINDECRKNFSGISLTLMANEGCLIDCPYKLSHDAHIAFANTATCPDRNYEINHNLGCIRLLSEKPEEIFKSPFIRPEDQGQYEEFVDVLKICGRTLGAEFLQKTITAYIEGSFSGNLLSLLDTQDWQVNRHSIANDKMPEDFFKQLTNCSYNCETCGYCKTLFKQVSRFSPLDIKDYRTP